MRPIKFRAWDGNQMLEVTELQIRDSVVDYIVTSEAYKVGMDNIELMQYTGLKDSKGKEIYEGDILIGTSDNWDAMTPLGEKTSVVYSDTYAGFYPFVNYDGDCCIETKPEHVEVIGNIYENPELLKENK